MKEYRTYSIGSKWLYLKIYTGKIYSNKILLKDIYPIMRILCKEKAIESFFFIRYADPYYHIRLRMLLSNNDAYNRVLSLLHNRLKGIEKENIIWKIEAGSYNQEEERYGKKTIGLCENIFFIDSLIVLEILKKIGNDANAKLILAIFLIDQYLSLFSLDITAKKEFSEKTSCSFQKEFGMNSRIYTKRLNDIYRIKRNSICNLLEYKNVQDLPLSVFVNKKNILSVKISNLLESLDSKQNKEELIFSIIHMSLNRFFYSDNRLNEFIVYYFIQKAYSSIVAKYSK